MKDKTIIVIAGPTASGKTELAIRLARHFHTSIISADSRQCFRELNIGVAKPPASALDATRHYFINSHSISDSVDAALFERLALVWAAEIFEQHDTAIIAGGTGLYIKAFCEGLDEIPATDPALRDHLQSQYTLHGLSWLQAEVRQHDTEFYLSGEIQNPRRLMRALEIKQATGKSILSFRSQQKKARPFRIIKIGLEAPREKLYQRINHRVDEMIAAGLAREVAGLETFRTHNALQTVGYSEIFRYLDGEISLDEAIILIKRNTRHYAKRQMTWFKKDKEIHWIEPGDWEMIKKVAFS